MSNVFSSEHTSTEIANMVAKSVSDIIMGKTRRRSGDCVVKMTRAEMMQVIVALRADLADARKENDRLQAELSGKSILTDDTTDLVEVMFEAMKRKVRAGSLNAASRRALDYRISVVMNSFPQIILRRFKNPDSDEANNAHNKVATQIADALMATRERAGNPLSANTMKSIYHAINSSLNECGFKKVTLAQFERRVLPCQRYVRPEKVSDVIDACEKKNKTLGGFVRILARTGLRLSEAMSLRPDCVQTISGLDVIMVRHLQQSRTKRHDQVVPCADPLVLDQVKNIPEHGWPFHECMIHRFCKSMSRSLDIDITPHALRRTWKCVMTRYSDRVRLIPESALKVCMGHTLSVHEGYQAESWLLEYGASIAEAALMDFSTWDQRPITR